MNTSEHPLASVTQGEFPLLALLPPPKDATEKAVRLCDTEQDAIAVAIQLSHLSQANLAKRIGISRSYLTMLKSGERTMTTAILARFCVATGSNLVKQYRAMHSAWRAAQGAGRAADRIAHIASFTRAAA